jgi:hypothetical protein
VSVGRPAVYRLASPEAIQRWERLAARQGVLFLFFTFVLPLFPSDLMCYVAGLGTISVFRFFIANILGRLVVGASLTLIGSRSLHMPLAYWLAAARIGQRARVTGVRQSWRRSAGEHGETVYLMSFEDLEDMLDVLIPAGVYHRYHNEISGEKPFLVEGEILLNPSTGEPFMRAVRLTRLAS